MEYDYEAAGLPLPPDVQEAIEAAKAAHERAYALQVEQRQLVADYAWLLCACRPWPDPARRDMPPQEGCPVHGTVMVTLDGRVI